MGNSGCCSKEEEKFEAIEKKDGPKLAPDTPTVETFQQPTAPAAKKVEQELRPNEYKIVLDKTSGQKLGMDVDHARTSCTLRSSIRSAW